MSQFNLFWRMRLVEAILIVKRNVITKVTLTKLECMRTCDKMITVGIDPRDLTIWRATWVWQTSEAIPVQIFPAKTTFPLAEPPGNRGYSCSCIATTQAHLLYRSRKHHREVFHPVHTCKLMRRICMKIAIFLIPGRSTMGFQDGILLCLERRGSCILQRTLLFDKCRSDVFVEHGQGLTWKNTSGSWRYCKLCIPPNKMH